ncbi:hypothetical protein [uncultured Jannaschia sp.]|uniref:hypothetical protein n=1 Tax=uncultured Jannaschia sp. TaxID=293347 RepID=UPI002636297C|nr:hypothetical protein [uncultured Jannaschia sp.]
MTTFILYLSILAVGFALSFRLQSRAATRILRWGSVVLSTAFIALAILTRSCGAGFVHSIFSCDEPTVDRLLPLLLTYMAFPMIALAALVLLAALEWRARR